MNASDGMNSNSDQHSSSSIQGLAPTPAGDIGLGGVAEGADAADAALEGRPQGRSEAASPRRKRSSKLLAALVFGGLTYAAAALGRPLSKKKLWYRTLRKSEANPPPWVFGAVWSVLYPTIAYSGYRTWTKPASPARTHALRLWGLQMALNASWTPLFFGAHKPRASLAVAGALVPTVAGYALRARKVDKLAAGLMLPYLGWSAFAAYLNTEIVRKNADLVSEKAAELMRERFFRV